MATVGRVEAVWQNFIGAPGFSRFTFEAPATATDATTITGKVRAFFNSLATLIPNGVTVQVQQAVPIYDEQTGQLVNEISATSAPAVVTGSSTAPQGFAGGAGAMVGWKTVSIWQGRRVQGRTFLVPLEGITEANGTIASVSLATIQTAANGMVSPSTPAFGVWAKRWDRTNPAKPVQVDGSFFLATTATVPDKTGILKSRRD